MAKNKGPQSQLLAGTTVSINVPAAIPNPATVANGGSLSPQGTFTPTGGLVQVVCNVVFSDANDMEKNISVPVTMNQTTGHWNASTPLSFPIQNWRYLLCVIARNPADGSSQRRDRHIDVGSPH